MEEGLQAGVDMGTMSMGSSMVDESKHASSKARRSILAKQTCMHASVDEHAASEILAENTEDAGGDLPKQRQLTCQKVPDDRCIVSSWYAMTY